MKKSTGSILLLSAFAALVLAGCNNGPKDSSTSTGSSDTAVTTSADGTSTPAGNSDSATSNGTSAAGTSTTTSSASSSAAASSKTTSSSSAAASSSTQPVETDWSNKSFIGEYFGGMSNLIINADKTTSWETSTDKIPATYTDMGGGIYMIKSAAGVADEDYVEIITDGTMAYVMHNKEAYDYFVMDKNAVGGSAIAFCETTDETQFFGGIEVTASHWKYFACINGTYTFGASITMQAGTNINAGGAIFDYGTGSNKTSWKVTTPAPTATTFAKIEQTNFTATTYSGDHGDLIIGTDDQGLVFAKLNGVVIDGAQLSADGTVLSVPNGSAATSYDRTDPAGPMKVVPTTTYTLAKIALTYTQGEGTMKTPLFPTITADSGTYTADTDNSGNVWVVYVATESGTLDVLETAGQVSDSYLSIYDSTAQAYTTAYGNSYAIGEDDHQSTTGVHVAVTVIAGHAYVIKLGAYGSRSTDFNGTSASYADKEEEFDWTFTPFTHNVYTGDDGELDIMMDQTEIKSITLAGTPVTSYEKINDTLTTVTQTADMTNPLDIVITTTTKTFTLDSTTHTYTVGSSSVDDHPFGSITATDTSYSGVTGSDGNMWVTFTPSVSGRMTVKETQMGVSDSYLQIFEWDPATGIAGLTTKGAKQLGGVDFSPIQLTVNVRAGVTYVIKLGAYASRDTLVGEAASSSANVGCNETFSFEFVDYLMETFTGASGDLVIATKDGEFKNATLAGNPITGRISLDMDNGLFSIIGTQTLDQTNPDDPMLNSTDQVYTLDLVNHTYTVASVNNSVHVVNVLTDTSTGLSGYTGADGNLWASFTPTTDGVMSIQETVQATNGSGSHDTLLAVYEKTATSTFADYINYSTSGGTNGLKALNAATQYSSGADNSTNPVYVNFLPVQAGHTYIIKIGAFSGNGLTIGGQLASYSSGYAGQPEAFSFNFGQIVTNVYTNDTGDDLTLKTVNGQIYSATLGTTAITNGSLSADGKAFTVAATTPTLDTSNAFDPVAVYTDTIYYLDNSGSTYETDAESTYVHYFHVLNPDDTSYTAETGKDGNIWAIFTAPEDGVIEIEETQMGVSDSNLQVFEVAATDDVKTLKSSSSKILADEDNMYDEVSATVAVEAGKTYVIKLGSYYARNNVVGDTSTYAGYEETFSFTYTGYSYATFTGDEGDLVKKSFGDTYLSATLNGAPLTATPNADQTVYTQETSEFNSDDLTIVTDGKKYTLGDGTYTAETYTTTTNLLADTWTAGNSGTYEAASNGAVIIKFTPTADGEYTFRVSGVTGKDLKIGLYADNFNENGFAGSYLKFNDSENYGTGGESLTYTCTAGTTYYLKVSTYGDFSKSITNLNSTNAGLELAVEIVDPTPAP